MNSQVSPIPQLVKPPKRVYQMQWRGPSDGPKPANSQRGDRKEMLWGFMFSLPLACAAVLLFSSHKRRAKRRRYLKQLKAALEFGDLQTAPTRPHWLNRQ
jgi:hypothetical protein